MKKYVSYSELNTWEKNREEYYATYLQGKEFQPNEKMKIGTLIHSVNEHHDYPWIPEARALGFRGKGLQNLRKAISKVQLSAEEGSEAEVAMVAKLDDFMLFIKMDRFHKKNRTFDDLKCTDKPHWQNWQVHQSFQFDFYALTYYLSTHQFLTELRVRECDWKKGNLKTIASTRSYRDILVTQDRVRRIVQEMKDAGIWKLRLSRDDRNKLNQGRLL
jgi:hypothetical protein